MILNSITINSYHIAMSAILTEIDSRGVATIIMNRPESHNAFDDKMILQLHSMIAGFVDDCSVRVVVLKARGKSFSAGADLNWMKRMTIYSEEENYRDALDMADFFYDLSTLALPTIAVVQGAAFGGGVGLVAACDIAIAADAALFGVTEVKLGLIPAVISPYLSRAMGERNAQRYALTGERFSAADAKAMGLVHKVVRESDLDWVCGKMCDQLLANGPEAMAAVKRKLFSTREADMQKIKQYTAEIIAAVRVSKEGQEGLAAFLEKRLPAWRK